MTTIHTLNAQVREVSALAESLACGHRDTHGKELGDRIKAIDMLAAKLITAANAARELAAGKEATL